jgi:hypothetical protein
VVRVILAVAGTVFSANPATRDNAFYTFDDLPQRKISADLSGKYPQIKTGMK